MLGVVDAVRQVLTALEATEQEGSGDYSELIRVLEQLTRSSGVGVVLIGQTWASMGPDDTTRSRLAGTVGTVVVHQLKQA